MKITLNLLPDREKEKAEEKQKLLNVYRICAGFIIAGVLIVAGFFALEEILKIEYEASKMSNAELQKNYSEQTKELENFLKELNAKTKQVNKINSEIPHWSKVFSNIAEMMPENLNLTQVQADKNHLKIVGFAKTRDAYLVFEERMNSQKQYENVKTPLSNLVSANDFSFTIETDVNNNYLTDKK